MGDLGFPTRFTALKFVPVQSPARYLETPSVIGQIAGRVAALRETVGDGIDSHGQFTDIQQAIDALGGRGGVVCVGRGVYTVGDTIRLAAQDRAGIVEIARPVGVVCAVTPSTNPAATPANKIINALKGRNAVIVAPSG